MLHTRRQGDKLVVSIDFELDQHHADLARAELEDLLADTRIMKLTLDLSGMSFMDSSGIGFLLGRARTMQKRGGVVQVTGARPHVQRIMNMSGLHRVIETRPAQGLGGS